MPNGKGYKNRDESQYQPAKLSDREREGQSSKEISNNAHDFNIKGKVTSNAESCYNDFGAGSGAYGNYDEKDASLAYLKDRNMKGQEIHQFTATQRQSKMHTHNVGLTAYNSNPIKEVYTPATSQHVPPPDAVIRPTLKKSEEA